MKKLALIACLTLALGLSACSEKTVNTTTTTSAPQTVSTISPDEAQAKGVTVCNEPLLDPSKTYKVVFTTTKGNFTVTLDVKNAPASSAHLAALVKSGFYDGLTFHRVVPDFVIQGGDPLGNGSGSSDCSVISEEPPRPYKQGDFAWAKAGYEPAGQAGSQFFIVTGADDAPNVQSLGEKAPQSDGSSKIQYGYAGSVTSGLDVALAIEALAPTRGDGPPTQTVTITKAEVKS